MQLNFEPQQPFADRIRIFAEHTKEGPLRDLYVRAMGSVNWPQIEAIRRKYSANLENSNDNMKFKYLDVPFWTWLRLTQISLIGLMDRKPMAVLDLGCGCAHFSLLLKALGHSYVGTDIDEPFYIELCEALDVRRISHRIKRNEALPAFGGPFDLVTAFDISFNYVGATDDSAAVGGRRWVYFTPCDWTNFLLDASRQMTPEGRFYLIPNSQRRPDGSYVHEPEILEHMARLGAKPPVPNQSITFDLALRDLVASTNGALGSETPKLAESGTVRRAARA